jgi:diguanylate cyclase (GGDEF)-like protein
MIDLDSFKQVNDICGHSMGDQILRAFSSKLRAKLRKDDFCCRWGGDEFLLFLSVGQQKSEWITRDYTGCQLRNAQDTNFVIEQQSIPLSFSFGIAHYLEHSRKLDSLLEIADKEMLKTKKTVS